MIRFLIPGDADRPYEAAHVQAMTERRRQAVAGIGEHDARAHADSLNATDLAQRELWLRAIQSNTSALASSRVR